MASSSNRHALVTGTASGLGRALVDRLHEDGWRVTGLDRSDATGDLTFDVDVTDVAAVDEAVASTAAEFGSIDGVAACAGVFLSALTPVHALDHDVWTTTLGVNLTGSFNVARATLPHLMESKGAIVLVASTAADHAGPGGAAYAASKAGVRALTRSIALEYGIHGVRACSVSPGYMQTGMTAKMLDRADIRAGVEARIPLGRVSDPAEVADVMTFLLGPGASFLTGEDVTVDGGGGLMAYTDRGENEGMWSRHERRLEREASA